MKHLRFVTLVLLVLALGSTAAFAQVIPPYGEGQIGLQAVVLCESLTVRAEPAAGAAAVSTLACGDRIIVSRQENGWAECFVSDAEDAGPAGWVRSEYLAVDPAWYAADSETPVYAWNSTEAPRVALLDKGTTLPVLKEDGEWIVVGLRGASGWILKGPSD